MKISLLTDAPKHNLALMKISAWHKKRGDEVMLNMPLWKADFTYASVLFGWNRKSFIADSYGGPAFEYNGYLDWAEDEKPDYDLYGLDFSLGYTFRRCFRKCEFCKVPKMENWDDTHHSIWEFHDPKFKKICLLNNNTFFDPQWRETFQEIWDANLSVIDENGYDLRLVNKEKAEVLVKTKWLISSHPHFSWDRMQDEKEIIRGLEEINRVGFKWLTVHMLIGFDTTIEEDIYRCQKIHDMGHNPFPMIYEDDKPKPLQHKFRRMIYARYYKKDGNIEKAWEDYTRK